MVLEDGGWSSIEGWFRAPAAESVKLLCASHHIAACLVAKLESQL